MELLTCRKCKRIFKSINDNKFCPKCSKELEERFSIVKKYIQDHQGCAIADVSRETNVDVQQIKKWLKEERLELLSGSLEDITCEICGCAIKSGKYCEDCKTSLLRELKKENIIANKESIIKHKVKNKMRFL